MQHKMVAKHIFCKMIIYVAYSLDINIMYILKNTQFIYGTVYIYGTEYIIYFYFETHSFETCCMVLHITFKCVSR